MSSNGRNRGYIGRNEITSPKGVIDGRQSYLNEENKSWNYGTDWVRPIDWLQIPGYTFGEQVAYGLLAITDDEIQSNSVGLQISGNYTVDWGDGTIQSFSSGSAVRRSYDYSTIPSSTLTSKGFKQVLIKVTPQSGQNLTSVNFAITGITTGSIEQNSKWLELNFNVPSATSITLRSGNGFNPYIEKVYISRASSSWTNIGNLLYNFINLKSVYLPTDIKYTMLTNTFNSLYNLNYLPPIDTSLVTAFNGAMASTFMESLPNWNYSSATTMSDMARFASYRTIPFILSAPSVTTTTASSVFAENPRLEYIKGINFPNATTTSQMFINNRNLKEIEGLTLTRTTTIQGLFQGCLSLEKIGFLNGGTAIQNANRAFNSCYRLKEAPQLDLRNCTNASVMFNACLLLETVPGYTFGNNANLGSMFGFCYNLKKLPSMDFSNVAILDGGPASDRFFWNCFALESFPVKNLKVSLSLSNCKFGFTALSEIFSGLSGASGGSATLNITGNPGATFITAAQIASATALGWTITR